MKKAGQMVTALLLTTTAASAAPVLYEAYQVDEISIPVDVYDSATVLELTLSVDSACYALFTAGGRARHSRLHLELDGDSLKTPEHRLDVNGVNEEETFSSAYCHLLDPGEHTISIFLWSYWNTGKPTLCKYSYLQALIFLPDEPGAVTEQPTVEPAEGVSSLLTSGPYVNVAGATQLVDSSGRVIENAIAEDKVYVNNLPTGTYFARDEESTVVKIVKVD